MMISPLRFASVRFTILAMTVCSWCLCGSVSGQQTGTQRGATLGGLAGAIAGSIIGVNNDEPAAGALIGGAVGAMTGGMLGNANDRDRAAAAQRQYQYQQQQQLRTLPSPSFQSQPITPVQTAVSTTDVTSMSRSGLSDTVIINEIRKRGVQQSLQVNDIISLHQQGVSEAVITEMQRTPVGRPATTQQSASPVIVHQAPVIYQREVLPSYPVPVYHPPVIHHHTEY